MSVATQISRITGLRNRIRTKLISLGLLSSTPQRSGGNDLEDCTDAIEGITGTQAITSLALYDVSGKQYAQVSDPNIVAQNIAEGVTILGVTGSHSGSTPTQLTQSKDMYLGGASAPATVYPDSGYLLSEVHPSMVAQPTLIPENIKSGVTIMGVVGNYRGNDLSSIGRVSKNHTGSATVVNSISFNVSNEISDISEVVLCRIRSSSDSLSSFDSSYIRMFETMPNIVTNNYLYSYGESVFIGGIDYFNTGVSVTLSQGTLSFSSQNIGFKGDYILECYYINITN